ncbi:MAG: hypothetical protein IKM20_10245 [Erysipelotrichales bacterium]|nr:hypothetical protein [Erysipelotrichales bacterium]
MKKKVIIVITVLCLILLSSWIFNHTAGWFDGDILEYIEEHYPSNGYNVVSGEYLVRGEDEQGGFIIYEVITEDNESHLIRVHVEFHRHLNQVGPDFKIKGISEISQNEYEKINPPK